MPGHVASATIDPPAATGAFRMDQHVGPARLSKDNDAMRYRTLGRTGLRVSEVGCGGAPLGIPNYNEVWDPSA
ncbi:MAG: hypothetical protein M3R24_12105, partial [Chloroflexota bacterium]|nr:hypothetical protein [Chloroflexota bacterium]